MTVICNLHFDKVAKFTGDILNEISLSFSLLSAAKIYQ